MFNHFKHHSCTKCHKLESIQVRHCDCVWCLDGDQQQSPVFTAVTIHLGAGEGVALRFVTPSELPGQPDLPFRHCAHHTALPKAKTLLKDITTSCNNSGSKVSQPLNEKC